MAYSSGRVIEHECTGDEELLVKNLGIKNYKAAAVGVTKFSPLHDKVLEEIRKEIKRQLKNYSKDLTNTYKYRGEQNNFTKFYRKLNNNYNNNNNDNNITFIKCKFPMVQKHFI